MARTVALRGSTPDINGNAGAAETARCMFRRSLGARPKRVYVRNAALWQFLGESAGMASFLLRALAMCALLISLTPPLAAAAPPQPAALGPQDTLELQRIAAYLNGIRTMTAHFQQLANNGGVSSGQVWVARPGRMRFEYDAPNPITLLADSVSVYYWDKQLSQVSKYELKATPAWFFLRDPISFGGDVVVTRFERSGNTARVTVVEVAEPDRGSLTLVFTENPLSLLQWIVVDQQSKTTAVTLSNLQFGMALDPKLFQYQFLFSGSNR